MKKDRHIYKKDIKRETAFCQKEKSGEKALQKSEEVSTKPKNWRKLTNVFCPNHGTYIRW